MVQRQKEVHTSMLIMHKFRRRVEVENEKKNKKINKTTMKKGGKRNKMLFKC